MTERTIQIAVAWADLILTAAGRALRCLAVGAVAGWVTWAAWGIAAKLWGGD